MFGGQQRRAQPRRQENRYEEDADVQVDPHGRQRHDGQQRAGGIGRLSTERKRAGRASEGLAGAPGSFLCLVRNPSPRPPPRSGEGEQDS